MEQGEQEVFELTDLDVQSIGLVFRGANRKPFFVIKSQEVEMSEGNEDFTELIDELADVTEINESAWSQLVGIVKSALTAKPEPEPEPVETKTSSKVEPEAEDFAQAIEKAKREVEEEFTAKLEQEREARLKVEEAFAQEQRKRRLAEFGTVAEGYSSLPGTDEQFAADLMVVHDKDAEVYERLTAILKASNEAIEKGALFAQHSVGGSDAGTGDPFIARVEAIRKERFADKDPNVGFAEAMDLAMEEYPDLARAYAMPGKH